MKKEPRNLAKPTAQVMDIAAWLSRHPSVSSMAGQTPNTQRPRIMGIVNCTPDSFSDGTSTENHQAWIDRAFQCIQEGADILDLGAESTRPGALPVDENIQLNRLLPVIQAIRMQSSIPLSIDTSRALVAKTCVEAGAQIINDVSLLRGDANMAAFLAETGIPVILMHSRGTPQTMDSLTHYNDIIEDVWAEWQSAVCQLSNLGYPRQQIILDPGFGFAKDERSNWELLSRLDEMVERGHPVAVGLSRKRFLSKMLPLNTIDDRDMATVAANYVAADKGAAMVRVHRVGWHKIAIEARALGYGSHTTKVMNGPKE
jgi:dihydropteroate synthase